MDIRITLDERWGEIERRLGEVLALAEGRNLEALLSLGRIIETEIRQYFIAGGTQLKAGGAPWAPTHPRWVKLRGKRDDKPLWDKGDLAASLTTNVFPGEGAIEVGVPMAPWGTSLAGARRHHFGDAAVHPSGSTWWAAVDDDGVIQDGGVLSPGGDLVKLHVKIQARPYLVVFQDDIDRWWAAQALGLGFEVAHA